MKPHLSIRFLLPAMLLFGIARTVQATTPSDDSFASQVRPLMMKYCNDCHEGPNSYGLNFMNLKTADDFGEYQHRFVSVVRELERGAMPPRNADQPTADEKQLMVGWLRSQLKKLTPPGKPVIPNASRQIAQYVVQIYEDRNGHLWFGTMAKGAARYDGKSVTYLTKKDGLPGGGVTSFAEDTDGNLWIGTQEGICRYDGKSIKRFGESDGLPLLHDRRSPAPPGSGNVFADKEQNIWANMGSGVFRWQNGRFVRFEIPFDRTSIKSHGLIPGYASLRLEDRDGNQWFTVDGYGVLRFDGKKFTHFTKQDGLCSNNVNDMLQDKQGNLWFVCMQSHQPKQTGDGGVCRFDGKTFETFPNVKGLHHNDIYTIGMERNGNVWIGATGVGVYRYDGEQFVLIDKTDRMDLTWARGLQAFHHARNGTVWLGFSGGLFRVHGRSIINVDRDGPWDSVGVAMSRHVLGEPTASEWLAERTRAALTAIASGNSKQAGSLWQTLKTEKPDEPTVQESAINVLGYELLFRKKAKAATDVFKINTQLYPDAFNTFDSLADAYLRQGKEELAVKNYKRSLELNPDNKPATQVLREIAAGNRYRDRLVAPSDWLEEVISVPPSFAPTMALKGMEHLRLPPTFRDPKSDWFLSYLFAIDVSQPAKLTEDSIGAQLLIYFQGLASGGRDKAGNEIDTTKFSIKPHKVSGVENGEFAYTLNWREPFVNATPLQQNLRVKIIPGKNKHGVIFICGSPQPFQSPVWAELLRIRTAFESTPANADSTSMIRPSRHSMQAPPEEQRRIREKQRATGYGGGDIVASGIMDKEGNLWFCTSNEGVYRYDKSFRNFSSKDGLNSDKVWSVVETREGKLWFGTADGLCSYDGKTFTHVPIPGADDAKLVLSLLEDRRGNLWIGTLGGGAYRYDGKTFTSFLKEAGRIQPNGRHYNVIQSMTEDSAGNIWFTSQTHGGVSRYDGQKLIHFSQKDGLSDDMIFSSFEDQSGNMWFGTRDNGVCRFDGKTFTTFTERDGLRSRNVSCFHQDKQGKLWMGSFARSGVCCFDGKTFTNFPKKDGRELIDTRFIIADRNGHLWFGGRFGLLARFDGKKITDFTKTKH